MPRSIDLLVPDFGRTFGELEITVIDTKGVDDVAVREDLDSKLKDPRTAIVFCSRFNDAPGVSTRVLVQHMRQTFSERVDTGKVTVLALPRAEEARAMKDDTGEQALTDIEGYSFKGLQVVGELAAEETPGIPVLFFNVASDDAADIRVKLFEQLNRMRSTMADRLLDLCAAIDELIKNHEAKAITAAVEEVAGRLNSFLRGNRLLGAREHLAHEYALKTIGDVRYASTLWASARRSGEYSGLNVVHHIGVGAARDARVRCDSWFNALEAFIKSLKADQGLSLAVKSIEQIGDNAKASRTAFLEAVQSAGTEVYREPLTKSPIWSKCVSEWGQGPGFKKRVINHLESWFDSKPKLKSNLEDIVNGLWDQVIIAPLRRLAEEGAPEQTPSLAPSEHVAGMPEQVST